MGRKHRRILLESYGDSTHNRAKAWAAAGSDARMNGCELPVGHQLGQRQPGADRLAAGHHLRPGAGLGAGGTLPALVVSNLVTIHLKTGIGSLSAYCGATAAGCGARAGVCYLHGGRYKEIAHTIVNAVAIDSGMICDGAKASLRGQDRLGGGGGVAWLEDAAAPQSVLRRRRHCGQGR